MAKCIKDDLEGLTDIKEIIRVCAHYIIHLQYMTAYEAIMNLVEILGADAVIAIADSVRGGNV